MYNHLDIFADHWPSVSISITVRLRSHNRCYLARRPIFESQVSAIREENYVHSNLGFKLLSLPSKDMSYDNDLVD